MLFRILQILHSTVYLSIIYLFAGAYAPARKLSTNLHSIANCMVCLAKKKWSTWWWPVEGPKHVVERSYI